MTAWLVVSPPSSRYAALHELELRKHGCASLGSRLWRIPPSASLGPLVSSAASADDLLVPLRRATSLGELLRPASLKGNATPKFWSGDNPIVVVTGTLISLGVASSLVRNGGNGQLLLDASVVGAGLVFGLSRFQFK